MAETKQTKQESKREKPRYRVLCWGACETQGQPCGLDYLGRRAEEGAVVDDIPVQSIRHELEAGHIELVVSGEAGE